ncbi:MAG: hypothetical protein DRI94_00540 [Bacteroidetes bacterium]|nr:hypothetical protein [Bacteroidales bacterium]RLD53225.1 MAG: hypothetical protein DRI94_00540 [Bacteroidota bacterium]
MQKIAENKVTDQAKSDIWFEDLIATIHSHKLIYDTEGFGDKNFNKYYDTMIKGGGNDLLILSQDTVKSVIIKKMIVEYIKELNDKQIKYKKLAIDYNNSGLLTWFVIEDNDFDTEAKIYLTSAKINTNFYELGFSISNSIMEESDNLRIPEHYQILK